MVRFQIQKGYFSMKGWVEDPKGHAYAVIPTDRNGKVIECVQAQLAVGAKTLVRAIEQIYEDIEKEPPFDID